MIPCHDLRTGNFILVNNRMRKISAISNGNTNNLPSLVGVESITNAEAEEFSTENIDPVLLTDAILQQCNFIFHNYFRFWQLVNPGPPRTEMDIDLDYNIIDFMRRPLVKNIPSLHQLQNVYYMLHGKELEFDVNTLVPSEEKTLALAD
ncbi:MAG: hypothetical protein ACJ75B_18130 [Flavisolibacter sp.]